MHSLPEEHYGEQHPALYTWSRQRRRRCCSETLYKIVDGKAEALEFIAADSFEFLKVPIKDMHIKKSILLACIIRGGRIIYPHGGDTIEAGDSVIVVAKSDEALRDLEDIIE